MILIDMHKEFPSVTSNRPLGPDFFPIYSMYFCTAYLDLLSFGYLDPDFRSPEEVFRYINTA